MLFGGGGLAGEKGCCVFTTLVEGEPCAVHVLLRVLGFQALKVELMKHVHKMIDSPKVID